MLLDGVLIPFFDRRIKSTVRGAVMYLAAFFTVARLHRAIVFALRPSSCFSTSGEALPLIHHHLYPQHSPSPAPCASDRRRPLGAQTTPPHMSLSPLSLIPRQAVATVNAREKTVVDGKKTIVIRRRPPEAREMLVEAVGELREEEGVWLEGISWRNTREAEAEVAWLVRLYGHEREIEHGGRGRERRVTPSQYWDGYESDGVGVDPLLDPPPRPTACAGGDARGRWSNEAGGRRMTISLSTAPRERGPPSTHRLIVVLCIVPVLYYTAVDVLAVSRGGIEYGFLDGMPSILCGAPWSRGRALRWAWVWWRSFVIVGEVCVTRLHQLQSAIQVQRPTFIEPCGFYFAPSAQPSSTLSCPSPIDSSNTWSHGSPHGSASFASSGHAFARAILVADLLVKPGTDGDGRLDGDVHVRSCVYIHLLLVLCTARPTLRAFSSLLIDSHRGSAKLVRRLVVDA
ncbi:hypothetical protein C8R45DRAFT_1109903 [Mycena sanguinolenta]|nr:hypothetical protein C8R45DRAFT_1109903 [Mycena sanguinolenta]